ncbi:MAG: galactose mutarotase, partial [Polaromonas sp.]|nr:galactose mutarotase [Polaromonas sp.]
PGKALDGGAGKNGVTYCQQQSLCLEPQRYPNAPNQPGFPSSVVESGTPYRGTTVYRFGVTGAPA